MSLLHTRTGVFSIIAAASISLASCTNNKGGDNALLFQSLDPELWQSGEALEFIPDSATLQARGNSLLRPILILRYSRLSPTAEFPVEVLQENFDGEIRRDTIPLRLFDASGRPTGQGSHSVYEIYDTLPPTSIQNGWRLTITPLSPARGIQAAGISLPRPH
ncbi:MAG: gliding motility lipoprotein GldH [Clostridium sp.]|nr:gliding motility lipoprotein GldH [Prevotella sp.]MCM1428518.1 gliding motility lipoprotein GldH [Clostridium sp.]